MDIVVLLGAPGSGKGTIAAKLAAAEKQNTQAKQSQYNRETSPGSAASAAGAREEDPFVEGLFETWG